MLRGASSGQRWRAEQQIQCKHRMFTSQVLGTWGVPTLYRITSMGETQKASWVPINICYMKIDVEKLRCSLTFEKCFTQKEKQACRKSSVEVSANVLTIRPIIASGIVGCREMAWYMSVVNKRILPCDNWWFYTTVWLANKLLKQQIILRALQQASTRILFRIEILRYRLPCIPPGFDMISHQEDCSWSSVGLLCTGECDREGRAHSQRKGNRRCCDISPPTSIVIA